MWQQLIPTDLRYYPMEEICLPAALSSWLKPSVRDKAATNIFPKVQAGSRFFAIDGGVWFQTGRQNFFLRGDTLFALVSELLPLLQGTISLAELSADLSDGRKETFIRLVRLLLEGGFLIDCHPEPLSGLLPVENDCFEQQLQLLTHVAVNPHERFVRFRKTPLLLIGEGTSFLACGKSLLQNGLETLNLLPTDERQDLTEIQDLASNLSQKGIHSRVQMTLTCSVPSLRNFTTVIYCTDNPGFYELIRINRACSAEGCTFLCALLFGRHAILGPLVKTPASGCYVCTLMHLSDYVEEHVCRGFKDGVFSARGLGAGEVHQTALAALLGSDCGFEIFKVESMDNRAQTEGGMLLQHIDSNGSIAAALVSHPISGCRNYCTSYNHSVYDEKL